MAFEKFKQFAATKYGLVAALALLVLAFAAYKAFLLAGLPHGLGVAMLILSASVVVTCINFYYGKRKPLKLLFFIVILIQGLLLNPVITGIALAYLPAILLTYAAYVLRKDPAKKDGQKAKNAKKG